MKPLSLAISLAIACTAESARICSALQPYSHKNAAQAHPDLKNAIETLKENAVATWYTDRYQSDVSSLLAQCQDAIPSIVVYGLPEKDCGEGGFSQGGANKNTEMYRAWIQKLVDQVGKREVIYVLEPDAIGLVSQGGCGIKHGYLPNMKIALGILASNPNARIYADVSSWSKQGEAIKALNELKSAGRLAGIAINTSNYRKTSELNELCKTYSASTGGLHCVFDISRNYNGSPQNEWCNARSAGIGSRTTDQTGNPLVDYHLWIKVPGESDGECTGRGPDAMVGPGAGQFFYEGFKTMWNQGFYVTEMNYPKIGDNKPWPSPSNSPSTAVPSVSPTYDPKPSSSAPTPSSSAPTPSSSTSAPSTPAPSRTNAPPTKNPSPSSTKPATPTPSSSTLVQAWQQCGGNNYQGSTQCIQGYTCYRHNDAYSQCVPQKSQEGQVDTWGQCSGKHYTGHTQCKSGDKCEFRNDYYSQCVPSRR